MRIDAANLIPPDAPGNGPQSVQKPSSPGDSADARIADDDTEIRSALAPYVRAAMAAEEVDEQAVADARNLLRSGQLDSPEAARRAAESLLRLGP